jgi:hypothetical protein
MSTPVPSGAVGKDCQRRLLSRPRFVRAVAPRIYYLFIIFIQKTTLPLGSQLPVNCRLPKSKPIQTFHSSPRSTTILWHYIYIYISLRKLNIPILTRSKQDVEITWREKRGYWKGKKPSSQTKGLVFHVKSLCVFKSQVHH